MINDGKTLSSNSALSDFSLLARSDHGLEFIPARICSDSKEVFVVNDKNKIFVFNTDLKFLRKCFTGSYWRLCL